MVTQEFYIRNVSETEARGPFNHEQMVSLAEAGQLTAETLYYDVGTEQWLALATNAEICASIFPKKNPLKLKARTQYQNLNKEAENLAPIKVTDLLAAAEGRSAETADKLDPTIARERAAAIGRWSATLILLMSAVALALPAIDVLSKPDLQTWIHQPLALLGLGQILLAILLMLKVTQVYPLIRLSCTLGIGLVGVVLWTRGQIAPLTSFTIGSVGLYFCTVFINTFGVGLAAGLGLVGMAGYVFFAITT